MSNVVEKFQGNMQTAFSALPLTNTQNMLAAISGKSKIHEAATALNPDKVLLAVGDKGADVAHLNTLLKLDNKDVYDAAAVTAFQEKHNKDYPENPMPVDGIAGKLTITALQKEAAKEFSPTVDAKTTTVAQNVQPLQTPNIIDGINQFYQKAIRTSG